MTWQLQAACGDYDPQWWEDDRAGGMITDEHVKAAEICRARCRVFADCLRYARSLPREERRAIYAARFAARRGMPLVPRPRREPDKSKLLRPCGTPAAYVRHRRNNEAPCGPCQTAKAAAESARDRRRRERAGAPPLCGCGCGEPVQALRKGGTWAPCRRGHASRPRVSA